MPFVIAPPHRRFDAAQFGGGKPPQIGPGKEMLPQDEEAEGNSQGRHNADNKASPTRRNSPAGRRTFIFWKGLGQAHQRIRIPLANPSAALATSERMWQRAEAGQEFIFV